MNTKNEEKLQKAYYRAKDILAAVSTGTEEEKLARILALTAPSTVPIPELSKESMDILATVALEAKDKGIKVLLKDGKVLTKGSRKGGGGARPESYTVGFPDGKTATVEGGKLRGFMKENGIETAFWAKYPDRDRKASLSGYAMIESLKDKGYTVEAHK